MYGIAQVEMARAIQTETRYVIVNK